LKFLITGISGLLGHVCAREAQKRQFSVVGVQHTATLQFPSIRVFKSDLTNEAAADQILEQVRPDWVIHCAALTNVDYCESHQDEAFRINSLLPDSLSKSAERLGARLVHVSTDAVFDGRKGEYTEADLTNPVNVYAHSKLLGEKAVLQNQSNLVVRTTMFGWNIQPRLSLAEWVLHELRCGRKIDGFVDVVFNPLLTTVCANMIFDLLLSGARGLYHLAANAPWSKYRFAYELAKVFELDSGLIAEARCSSLPNPAVRPLNTSLATTKATGVLGRKMPTLEEQLYRFRQEEESERQAALCCGFKQNTSE
jgi:dTDP-4-dehydrorhamnose reductase